MQKLLQPVKVAILDLYDNEPNQGMRCIQEIVRSADGQVQQRPVSLQVYETRYKSETPGLEHDIYISSGGPGSPFDGMGKKWETQYFQLLDAIWSHNQKHHEGKKYLFFICHSFQMMARFFEFATVQKREKRSFGIIPVAKAEGAERDWMFKKLPGPFYAADFRQYEVIQPRETVLNSLNATILAREAQRSNPNLEKALMAARISDEIMGTQFHPEADPVSMLFHFRQPERKQQVVDEYGEVKYYEMIARLEDPENILLTRRLILPRFIRHAIRQLTPNGDDPNREFSTRRKEDPHNCCLPAANE